MPSFRPAVEQAKHLTKKKARHGVSRSMLPKGEHAITSVATESKYRGNIKCFIEWLEERNRNLNNVTPELATSFLKERSGTLSQKTLDGYRQSIQMVLDLSVRRVLSSQPTILHPRAYTNQQIASLCAHTSNRMRLSIEVARNAGLRAHELDTISSTQELNEDKRPWLKERFTGRDGVRYVVTGKGGLRRAVVLEVELAVALEKLRLPIPEIKREREINYLKRYSTIGGQKFSQRFTRLSVQLFGWSTGAHGLRHSFAQDRIQYLQSEGFYFDDALQIVAQELGHFSTKNTLSYLR